MTGSSTATSPAGNQKPQPTVQLHLLLGTKNHNQQYSYISCWEPNPQPTVQLHLLLGIYPTTNSTATSPAGNLSHNQQYSYISCWEPSPQQGVCSVLPAVGAALGPSAVRTWIAGGGLVAGRVAEDKSLPPTLRSARGHGIAQLHPGKLKQPKPVVVSRASRSKSPC